MTWNSASRATSTGPVRGGSQVAARRAARPSTAPPPCSSPSSSRPSRAASPRWSTSSAWPARRPPGCCRRWSATSWSSATAPAASGPGSVFATFAVRHDRLGDLVELAQPSLERLGKLTGETINLAVPDGEEILQVSQVDGRHVLGAMNWLDVDVPAHCSAVGKLFYALRRRCRCPTGPLPRRTPHTITTARRAGGRARGRPRRSAGPAPTRSSSPAWSRSPRRSVTPTARSSPASRSRARCCGSAATTSPTSPPPWSPRPTGSPGGSGTIRRPTRRQAVHRTSHHTSHPSSPVRARGEQERQEPHDPRRDPQGALRRDADRQRAARARADPARAGHRPDPGDDALRGADPLAGGGRCAVRAR